MLRAIVCPKRLILDLKWHTLGDKGAKIIFSILKLKPLPKELYFNLQWGNLMNPGAIVLSNVLKSINTSSRLKFNLRWNNINHNGIRHLANVIHSGQCPYKTHIDGLETYNLDINIHQLCQENDLKIINHRDSGHLALILAQPSFLNRTKTIFLDELIDLIISYLPQPASLSKARTIKRKIAY